MRHLALAALMLATPMAFAAGTVNIYNWPDYIAPDTLSNFQRQTGIETRYSLFDSNDTLEKRLRESPGKYDVIFPSNHFMNRHISAGNLKPLDRTRLPNWKYLNPALLRALEINDPGNRYGFPYLFGVSGIGYNVDQVRAALGNDAPVDSWDLVFKPENIARLQKCGVAILDIGPELLPMALNYLGLPSHSQNPADYDKAQALLLSIKPYVRYFDSVEYSHQLAEGKLCAVVGFSGDVLQAQTQARQAGKGVEIEFTLPREGSTMWFDMVAIPADAPNEDAAYTFLNYLLDPKVMANITNSVHYANGNEGADEWVDPVLKRDRRIYPSAEVMSKLFLLQPMPAEIEQLRTRIWNQIRH
ncbi:polyamine ABC transporter substrate-binding protein [Pseudomonas rhizosphaerae]|uniref:polyamine ABC transporter substrate-binding protein n=1 Tax=Pseudomonas rhizosphaerae TaxID=216142 RepID=UPI002B4666B0|nr:polyamine ABC transporter substrate-binding protein [Pseudomonas rhizosphaerae]MEB2872079.1 polyamine ABC transporter substrate-binding protein [Pseudomonas rhizosphaerae]